ncbi:DUF3089 domain-containing protein [Hymenobacter siberiensis]|uniref:DUF3089 domain-containing protein n=1 Tax=Hymenobacter siberiensis TaxID=2848396 RepID=UPI001C1E67EB|nr:DUF3089 domain-containing protein [Hymenobacter siberiensis]MBU6120116.1 DUF3089 domain-containing protein [Hymenobacter siberiensis]
MPGRGQGVRLLVWAIILSILPLTSCLRLLKPPHDFAYYHPGPVPNYAEDSNWAALPTRCDPADAVPRKTTLRDQQATAEADVFFVHPTTYFWRGSWNASVANARLNCYTDRSAIRKQATVFNATARIYAPRYRQATLYSFFDSTAEGSSRKALALAYADVRTAFQYYLTHYNQGRPIIIAGHSQGTDHATRLLHEFFDNDLKLRRQLVAAYLIGFRVQPHEYQTILPCADSLSTGCFVAYNSVATGNEFPPFSHVAVTNPLTWTTDTARAPASLNRGGVSQCFKRIDPHVTDAKIHDGLLWVTPPKPGGYPRFLLPGELILRHSFHIADYSLFYMNLRENAQARVRAWQLRSK